MSQPAVVVQATGVHRTFGELKAVDGISLSVEQGEIVGLVGPDGAGKTTTLRMLLGLTPTSGGHLSMFGMDVGERARDIRTRVGVVPQADNLDPDFSVGENLRIYASYFGLPKRGLDERIDKLLSFAALTERRNAKTDTLSGGMKRRLTIARALINDPELVVLDEPTTGLDPQARHVIWGRLNELRDRGTTLILTTHYMEEAERLCDELVIMDRGRILDQGSPKELIARHVEPELVELRAGASGLPDGLDALPGCRIERMGTSLYCYTRDPKPLLEHLQQTHGVTFLHRPTGLEDVFLKLTGRELRD